MLGGRYRGRRGDTERLEVKRVREYREEKYWVGTLYLIF